MTQAQALDILKTGVNAFLTGEPGSGKTYTVNAYVQWLRAQDIEPAITASTGIAATHIHGMTIHAWSGIGVRESLSELDIDAIASKEHVARRIQRAPVLLIDEVSMLSANVLAMVDAVCREVRRSPEPFGGMQVVLIGDFFQLPPVGKRGTAPAFAFQSSVWEELNPIVCYLSEQHRQSDLLFLSVLSAIRAADDDPGVVSSILSRETDIEGFEEDVTRLYTHNADVDRINEERLAALATSARTFAMEGSGAPLMIEALMRGCLSPQTLVLKEGAIVIGTKNVAQQGLSNGTLGTVIGFERHTNFPIIETNSGKEITIAPAEWAVEEGGKVRAKITQIPLRLAWAITVHKSQGMSLDAAAIDLSNAFEYGQGYVALSRVRTLSGLYLLGWSENALLVHPLVRSKDEQFKDLSDEADASFGALKKNGALKDMQQAFVKGVGGSWNEGGVAPARAKTLKTHDQTLKLLQGGLSLTEAAKARGITYATAVQHAGKLLTEGKLTKTALTHSLSPDLQTALPNIHAAFKACDSTALTSIFHYLDGAWSFEDLRAAKLLLIERSGGAT